MYTGIYIGAIKHRKLNKTLKQININIVLAHMINQGLYGSGLVLTYSVVGVMAM